jgi:hypothetical protein
MIDHSVLYSSQDHLETEICDLDHLILAGAKNTDKHHMHMPEYFKQKTTSRLEEI